MNPAALVEKIEALPSDKREAAEKYVDGLRTPTPRPDTDRLMERARARREVILRRRGRLDSSGILRDVREHGA